LATVFCQSTNRALEISFERLYQPMQIDAVPHDAIAALAQVVEHIIRNDGVRGSSPLSGTIFLA
jgi:hypothetical protein